MALVDVERRQHADDILAGRDGQQPVLVAQMRDEGAAVRIELEPEHQPDPAHAVEQLVMVRSQLVERAAQPLAGRLDLVEQSSFELADERRVGKEGGGRCRCRWSRYM